LFVGTAAKTRLRMFISMAIAIGETTDVDDGTQTGDGG